MVCNIISLWSEIYRRNGLKETSSSNTTHMQYIPIVVCQSHGQGQWEMSDNCFSEENRISLVQVSQTPVKTI